MSSVSGSAPFQVYLNPSWSGGLGSVCLLWFALAALCVLHFDLWKASWCVGSSEFDLCGPQTWGPPFSNVCFPNWSELESGWLGQSLLEGRLALASSGPPFFGGGGELWPGCETPLSPTEGPCLRERPSLHLRGAAADNPLASETRPNTTSLISLPRPRCFVATESSAQWAAPAPSPWRRPVLPVVNGRWQRPLIDFSDGEGSEQQSNGNHHIPVKSLRTTFCVCVRESSEML